MLLWIFLCCYTFLGKKSCCHKLLLEKQSCAICKCSETRETWSDLLMLLSLKSHKYYWEEAWAKKLKTSEIVDRTLPAIPLSFCPGHFQNWKEHTSVQVHLKVEALPRAYPSFQPWGGRPAKSIATSAGHTWVYLFYTESVQPGTPFAQLTTLNCLAWWNRRRWGWARWMCVWSLLKSYSWCGMVPLAPKLPLKEWII